MKAGVANSLKFKRLKRLLQQPDCMVAGVLEMVWGLAVEQARLGDVGRFSDEEIAAAVDWPGDPAKLVSDLVTAGWLDRTERGRLVVHDWVYHAPQFIVRWIGRHFGIDPKVAGSVERTRQAWLANFGLDKPDGQPRLATPPPAEEMASQTAIGDDPCGRGSNPTKPIQTKPTPSECAPAADAADPPPELPPRKEPKIALPTNLETPEFRDVIVRWRRYRGSGYTAKLLAEAIVGASKRESEHGLPAVIEAFEIAMSNGWKGWNQASSFGARASPADGGGVAAFPGKGGRSGGRRDNLGPGQQFDPAAAERPVRGW